MNAYWLRLLLHRKRQQHRGILGITLVEIIVATVTATIVVAATLSAIASIGSSARDERVLTETQRDIEGAMSYITEELKEAVFIYNGDELNNITIPGVGNQPGIEAILGLSANNDREPILVFWKSVFSDAPADCAALANTNVPMAECEELRAERRTFTLVAYFLARGTASNFDGPARIRRYELNKYMTVSDLDLIRTPNYIDPLKESPSFAIWPYDGNGNIAQPVGGAALNLDIVGTDINENTDVLVGSIDEFDNPNIPSADLLICQGNDVAVGDPVLDDIYDEQYNDRYIRTPSDPTITSFFACVRDNLAIESGSQDTVLYLRGNPDGREGFAYDPNNPPSTPLPFVETQVVSRGTANKNFNN